MGVKPGKERAALPLSSFFFLGDFMNRTLVVAVLVGLLVGVAGVVIMKMLALDWNNLFAPLIFGVVGGGITVLVQNVRKRGG